MGMADDDYVKLENAPVSTVSIKAFYMDETEITNGEYKQFVNWVRDSVVRDALAKRAIFELGDAPSQEDLDKDNSINTFILIIKFRRMLLMKKKEVIPYIRKMFIWN